MSDPLRPRYHFMPPANWMNDPNGLIQWKDEYHLFYQHNPYAPHWDTMHWGHAVSRDLVHWRHLPIPLTPTPGGPDAEGCFTGCAVNDAGVPTLIYTGVHPEVQCLARSRDGLLTWQKDARNPVIAGPPQGQEVTGFRDPYVWREGDQWALVLGSGFPRVGGAALLYRSPNLIDWHYVGPLCVGDIEETGHNWECPNFFGLGDRHVLIISPQPLRQALYLTGDYNQDRFTPRSQGLLDAGGYLYAPQVMIDGNGRRLMWGWLQEGRDDEAQGEAGWSGVMSLPRELSLRADGTVASRPVPELQRLRQATLYDEARKVRSGAQPLLEARGRFLEIEMVCRPQGAARFGLGLLRSFDGHEATRIIYHVAREQLIVDRERSSLDNGDRERHQAACPLVDGRLQLQIYVDGSVIEVFANDTTCMTTRSYPTLPESQQVTLFAERGGVSLDSLRIWRLGDCDASPAGL